VRTIIVSDVLDGLGVEDGEPEGPLEPVGDGLTEGAGVSSGGPASMEGAAVGGVEGTWPRPPEVAQPIVASATTAATTRTETDER